MQNIDMILLLQPVLAIAMSVAGILYWRRRRGFRAILLLLALPAYAVAIALKVVIQAFTYTAVSNYYGTMSVEVGLYFGLQTVFLEVGLAYVFASLAVRRLGLGPADGVSYGLSLAFWENGALLGALPVLNLIVDYYLIASGSSVGQLVYSTLMNASPTYFLPPSDLIWFLLLGTLERLTSMLTHVAFGTLCVLAAFTRRKRFLAYALPMGLLDALVPFASLNVDLFEGGIFLLSLGFIAVAWRSLKQAGTMVASPEPSPPQTVQTS